MPIILRKLSQLATLLVKASVPSAMHGDVRHGRAAAGTNSSEFLQTVGARRPSVAGHQRALRERERFHISSFGFKFPGFLENSF